MLHIELFPCRRYCVVDSTVTLNNALDYRINKLTGLTDKRTRVKHKRQLFLFIVYKRFLFLSRILRV